MGRGGRPTPLSLSLPSGFLPIFNFLDEKGSYLPLQSLSIKQLIFVFREFTRSVAAILPRERLICPFLLF